MTRDAGLLLAGDIGGTKTDLAIFSAERGPRVALAQAEFRSQEYASLDLMVRDFLSTTELSVERACFAVAGPVIAGIAKITNLPWLLEEADLERDLGIASVHLMNDLEAIAYAVPLLQPDDIDTINKGSSSADGAIAVIAPGTGLGEAFLTREGDGYRAHASEGGHADFAPTNQLQVDLLQYLQKSFDHVSFERVCSGIGLPNIYDFLRDSGRYAESPEVLAKLQAGKDRTHVIVDAALHAADGSGLCVATLDIFTDVLAAEAANLALKVLATGGVYLAGGVATHIIPLLQRPAFMQSFVRKGRFGEMLDKMPVHVITAQAALLGAAAYGLGKTLDRDG